MSEHRIRLHWKRSSPDFDLKTYSRDHDVTFKNGQSLGMSSTPAFRGNPQRVDPEEAFVASLSSCHMLTFLALACRRGLIVNDYADDAVGVLEKDQQGRMAITRVALRPRIEFEGGPPDPAVLGELHEQAHRECFIANSVTTDVRVEQSQPAGA